MYLTQFIELFVVLLIYSASAAINNCLTLAFQIDVFINCVLASGLLKSVASTKKVVEHAINATVREPALREHFLAQLRATHSIPGRSTLYRHRLSLHMGFCRMLQNISEVLVSSKGGLASWRSLDLSPEGGIEWVLHGSSSIRQSLLSRAYDMAQALHQHLEDEAENARELSNLLALQAGVPVGVGSGRKSLKYKIMAQYTLRN